MMVDVEPSTTPVTYEVPQTPITDPVDVLVAVRDGLSDITPTSTTNQVREALLALRSALDDAIFNSAPPQEGA